MTAIRKRLIDVSIPLETINAASAREKSLRQGHPSTPHLWWAPRPLAACRTMPFAQLADDPSACPDRFIGEEAPEAESKRRYKEGEFAAADIGVVRDNARQLKFKGESTGFE